MKRTHNFPENWPAPSEYLLELGRMTSLWGALENTVNIAISQFAGFEGTSIDERALIMVVHSSFKQRVDIISSLCDWLLPEYPKLDNYKAVITKIREAQMARNKFAHNAITLHGDSSQVMMGIASARGTLKTGTEIVQIDDIKEATAKIHEAMCALYALVTGNEINPIWERDEQ